MPLTAEQKGKVADRARDEVRSVSSLVALLIVADLRRGRFLAVSGFGFPHHDATITTSLHRCYKAE